VKKLQEIRLIKPIIENDNINFTNLINYFFLHLNRVLKISLMILFIFVIYFFLKTPKYVSKVSFYTNYKDDMQSSLLSAVPGFMQGALGSNTLDFSVSNFISSEKFLKEIVNSSYNFNNQQITLTELWGTDYKNFLVFNPLSLASRLNRYFMYQDFLTDNEKKEAHASLVLYNSLSYNEDRRTKLNHISLKIENSPELATKIMDNIYKSIVTYSNEIVNQKASEKRQFIDLRLNEVKDDLENYENQLLDFSEKNKDINFSPRLTLQKDRIQKNISLHKQLYFTLADQLELAKINEKDNTSSFFLLDEPGVYSTKNGLSLIKGGLFIVLFSIIINFLILAIRDRALLFKPNKDSI
tara:strand:+ start:3120 stop:4181 length:1062 start_codon:yes stop_codon:yes gene_type:complete